MVAQAVEWVLVVHYGPEAHRATYGRQVRSNRYTKDYIQLSRKASFLETVSKLFSVSAGEAASVPLTYQWPTGASPGSFVFKSGDRPHLKWETNLGAPRVWKMTPSPNDSLAETIPGDPDQLEFEAAENEFAQLAARGAGQPYLMAIKLRDEPRTLHLRVYLANPSAEFSWADLNLAPDDIQALAAKTSQDSALAWSLFQSNGIAPTAGIKEALVRLGVSQQPSAVIDGLDADTGRSLANYLNNPGYGHFFDPSLNHDVWLQPAPLPPSVSSNVDALLKSLESRFPTIPQGDAVAESLEADPEQIEQFRAKIQQSSYEVADATATIKVRGSAQRAFAEAVKSNYGNRCAITGIATKDFLVASHIVPWSADQTIRLDPSNGICLSLIVDRAFEAGHLIIEDDLTIRIDPEKVKGDQILLKQLLPYDKQKVSKPENAPPRVEYLQRRRALI